MFNFHMPNSTVDSLYLDAFNKNKYVTNKIAAPSHAAAASASPSYLKPDAGGFASHLQAAASAWLGLLKTFHTDVTGRCSRTERNHNIFRGQNWLNGQDQTLLS